MYCSTDQKLNFPMWNDPRENWAPYFWPFSSIEIMYTGLHNRDLRKMKSAYIKFKTIYFIVYVYIVFFMVFYHFNT